MYCLIYNATSTRHITAKLTYILLTQILIVIFKIMPAKEEKSTSVAFTEENNVVLTPAPCLFLLGPSTLDITTVQDTITNKNKRNYDTG